MKWSTKVGAVSGIGIYIHWTFWFLIGWILIAYGRQGGSVAAALHGAVLVLAIFACVVLHELGHALTAKRFGIRTRDITLFPIGGVARLERMPSDPIQELWVALAGPAVNVVIALGLTGAILLMYGPRQFASIDFLRASLLVNLLAANVLLAAFNMLPAFPMDGGRVLRALLATQLDYVRATNIAATVGQVMAVVFGVLGFTTGNWILLFIALFVYLGAQGESHMAQIRGLLRGVPVRAAMITRFRVLSEDDTLSTVMSELLAGSQQDFPVVSDEQIVGILTRRDALSALADGNVEARVGDIMQRNCRLVDESEMLEDTFLRMREGDCPTLPVVRHGQLVGMVTLENVGEWLMIHSALDGRGGRTVRFLQ